MDTQTNEVSVHEQLMKYANDVSSLYQELKTKNQRLENAYNELVTVQYQTVQMAFDLIAMHNEFLGGHCQRVARYAGDLAAAMGQDAAFTDTVKLAALMHDVGLIGIPADKVQRLLLGREKNPEFVSLFRQHTDFQIRPLTTSDRYQEMAAVIRAHHELMDGSGFPRGLRGDAIPLGSRLIAVADRYDLLKQKAPKKTPPGQILDVFETETQPKYDREIFRCFKEVILANDQFHGVRNVDLETLSDGMALAEPILSQSGVKLLAAETILNREHIQRIRRFARNLSLKLPLRVYTARMSETVKNPGPEGQTLGALS